MTVLWAPRQPLRPPSPPPRVPPDYDSYMGASTPPAPPPCASPDYDSSIGAATPPALGSRFASNTRYASDRRTVHQGPTENPCHVIGCR